jgi:hypothetical protein
LGVGRGADNSSPLTITKLRNILSSTAAIILVIHFKINEMGWACCTHDRHEKCCRVLMEGSEGNMPLGSPKNIGDDNIKADHEDLEWGNGLAQDRDK